MSTKKDYTKGEDEKQILLTLATTIRVHTPKTLPVSVKGDHSYTIPIPKTHGAQASRIVDGAGPWPDDVYLPALGRDIWDGETGPDSPVIILSS